MTHTDNVCLTPDGTAVRILDQSRLPNETIYLELSRAEDLYEAIDLVACVEKRISVGGPSVSQVEKQIQYVKEVIA